MINAILLISNLLLLISGVFLSYELKNAWIFLITCVTCVTITCCLAFCINSKVEQEDGNK